MPASPRLVRRLLLVVAALALLAPIAPGLPTTSASAQELPTPTVAVARASAETVDVTWVSTADPHRWKVLAFSDGRYLGQRTFPGNARSGRVSQLPPGTSITTWVVPINDLGQWGTGATSPAVRLPRDPACPAVSGTCVHVNAKAPTRAATGAGLGLTHGFTAETDPYKVTDIGIRHWRIPALDAERWWYADLLGATTTAILSDVWANWYTRPDGRVQSPWADWGAYRAWVTAVAGWHAQNGVLPDQWEVQNEPGVHVFDPAFPPTTDLLVEQHRIAAEAIRSVIPGAKVVGPAVSPVLFGHGVEDIQAFTAKAAAAGLQLDALVWHENVGASASTDGGPHAVLQHIADAREAMAAAGMSNLPIDITEFAAPYEQLQPGSIVGYFSAFARGGVRYAGTACWFRPNAAGQLADSCFAKPGTLDGLLLNDGKTPTDAWWTYKAYNQLSTAGARFVPTSVDDPATSAVATVDGTPVRTLVGRHTGCTAADGPCPTGTTPGGKENVTVRMTTPTAGSWDIVVSKIASNGGASSGPTVLKRLTVSAGTSAISIGAYSLADGDVLQVDATPTPVKAPAAAKRR
jgi:hypothetical protein